MPSTTTPAVTTVDVGEEGEEAEALAVDEAPPVTTPEAAPVADAPPEEEKGIAALWIIIAVII